MPTQRTFDVTAVGNAIVDVLAQADDSLLAAHRLKKGAMTLIDTTFVSTVPLPDYEVLDLSVTFDATESLQIYGRVQNATDEAYQEVLGYNTAERSLYGGVRLRF